MLKRVLEFHASVLSSFGTVVGAFASGRTGGRPGAFGRHAIRQTVHGRFDRYGRRGPAAAGSGLVVLPSPEGRPRRRIARDSTELAEVCLRP